MPDKECFYRSTKDRTADDDSKKLDGYINDVEYLMCKKVCGKYLTWKIWVIITIIIWKEDVFILANVFEKFVDTCLKFYELHPCHFFSSPGLSWGAMLKMTGVKLEKISDINLHFFIVKGMRGGISYIAKRYS